MVWRLIAALSTRAARAGSTQNRAATPPRASKRGRTGGQEIAVATGAGQGACADETGMGVETGREATAEGQGVKAEAGLRANAHGTGVFAGVRMSGRPGGYSSDTSTDREAAHQ